MATSKLVRIDEKAEKEIKKFQKRNKIKTFTEASRRYFEQRISDKPGKWSLNLFGGNNG